MADLHENPLGTDGFEFVEFTSQNPAELEELFESMGFAAVAVHKTRNVTLYRQGQVNFLLNTEPQGQAAEFSKVHKAGANAMAFRVRDAKYAYEQALKAGAKPADGMGGSLDGEVLAIEGVGGSLLYLVDQYGDKGSIYDAFFTSTGNEASGNDCGLTYIDHLTHNLYRGNMDIWANYYESIFNFREIRYFDIEGKLTGLKSRAMTSPCGKIRIPLNESSDDKSQIEEFLTRYNGEGIQHIALGTDDIFYTVEAMAANDIPFQDTPDTYYEKIDTRLPGHGENVEKLKNHRVLVDGAPTEGQGLLLQIFTQDQIGPVFFEIIQRKGNEGFGEGNFQALFESIELDQIRRGVLDENAAEAG